MQIHQRMQGFLGTKRTRVSGRVFRQRPECFRQVMPSYPKLRAMQVFLTQVQATTASVDSVVVWFGRRASRNVLFEHTVNCCNARAASPSCIGLCGVRDVATCSNRQSECSLPALQAHSSNLTDASRIVALVRWIAEARLHVCVRGARKTRNSVKECQKLSCLGVLFGSNRNDHSRVRRGSGGQK
jgi:hypothetical protein